jgi:hypothetical protein
MTEHERRTLDVALRRMDALFRAISARQWEQTEFCYDQVLSKLQQLGGVRER